MALSIGTRIGPYEILSALGAGGMGEVYRARDTRLDRLVAVKVLAPELASDDFRARFVHEAKAISALNHPHICGLHEVWPSPGSDIVASPASRLFGARIQPTPSTPQYAVSADGQRFPGLERVEGEHNTMVFMLNWLEPSSPNQPAR